MEEDLFPDMPRMPLVRCMDCQYCQKVDCAGYICNEQPTRNLNYRLGYVKVYPRKHHRQHHRQQLLTLHESKQTNV